MVGDCFFYREESALFTESAADFTAYSRKVFSLKTIQFQEASEQADDEQQRRSPAEDLQPGAPKDEARSKGTTVGRCSISQTTLKFVRVSVVSLESCPSVDLPVLKEAFEQDSCTVSVDIDSEVHLNGSQVRRAAVSST